MACPVPHAICAPAISGEINPIRIDRIFCQEIIQQGIEHKGFSFIDVQSPCVTYNKLNTYDWFRERIYNLQEKGHDKEDLSQAVARAIEWPTQGPEDKVPVGVFYQTQKPTYEEQEPAFKHGAPAKRAKLGVTAEQRKELMAQLY